MSKGQGSRAEGRALAVALVLLLGGCGAKQTPGLAAPAVPDSSLVAVLGTLHLLEARQARFGDVPAAMRAEAMAAHGFSEASLRRAVERAQEDLPAWEALAVAVDAWMMDPARGGASYTQPDGVQEHLGSPALPPELRPR